jgi:hypothetical protein
MARAQGRNSTNGHERFLQDAFRQNIEKAGSIEHMAKSARHVNEPKDKRIYFILWLPQTTQ